MHTDCSTCFSVLYQASQNVVFCSQKIKQVKLHQFNTKKNAVVAIRSIFKIIGGIWYIIPTMVSCFAISLPSFITFI